MRRFGSEGSLLDIDFLPWRRVALKKPNNEDWQSGTYTTHAEEDELDCLNSDAALPKIRADLCSVRKKELVKEHSVSVEDLSEMRKDKSQLGLCAISEGSRAYSDSQLVPAVQGSTEDVGTVDGCLPFPPSSNVFAHKAQHKHLHKSSLTSAKLHLKSLFGQSPPSSNPNLSNPELKDGITERRSRLHFMRQWSQIGHSKRKISREELEKWAVSLNTVLGSQIGVSVFGAFLRSEFSEENLQFYLACEQYRHSSNNFSLQRRAKAICATYIQPGAPREVNLDSKTRDLTMELLQAPSHTSLFHAQKRIYSLLDTDCYPRFLQSSVYLSLLQEVDE
ncbi:uncharacterized protein V6R79_025236 [Siganus canaliculatus]